MTTTLDVLLLESHPSVGDAAAAALEAAGHRLHRCHEAGDTGFACRGLLEAGTCPLDRHVDVAVLARSDAPPEPTPHEDGVRCALRARVPLVEVGDGAAGPYDEWLTARAETAEVAEAVRHAVDLSRLPVAAAVVTHLTPTLRSAGIDASAVRCTVQSEWPVLDVHLHVDAPVDRALDQALSVRALDALRGAVRTYTTVNVSVDGTAAAGAR